MEPEQESKKKKAAKKIARETQKIETKRQETSGRTGIMPSVENDSRLTRKRLWDFCSVRPTEDGLHSPFWVRDQGFAWQRRRHVVDSADVS